jgi:hypothetical protein
MTQREKDRFNRQAREERQDQRTAISTLFFPLSVLGVLAVKIFFLTSNANQRLPVPTAR